MVKKNYDVYNEESTFIGAVAEMVDSDIWREHYAKEVVIKDIENCPIAVKSVMATNNVDDSLEEQTLTAMETTCCLADLPFDDGLHCYPVNEEAYPSLSDRAGLYGRTVKVIPSVLNVGIEINEDSAKFLIRNGMLVADHSGKYVTLKQDKLLDIFTDELKYKHFSNVEFVQARVSVSYTECYYTVDDTAGITTKINTKQTIKPCVRFTTSDTGKSGANIGCGVLIDDKSFMPFGKVIKLEHKKDADYSKFRSNCSQVLSLLRDQREVFDDLEKREVKHPQECFANIVKAQNLPRKEAKEVLDDFLIRCGMKVTALDLYLTLADITYLAERNGATHQKLLDIQENVSRIAFAKAIQWNEWDSTQPLL